MIVFKRFLDFFIQSSIYVGLAVFCLTYATSFENNLCRHITYPCCIMFGTILGYNFLKYFDVFRKGKCYTWKYYGIILVCGLAFFGFYFFYKRMLDVIKIQLFFAGMLVLVYPLLRKYGILKLFWVSFVITYLTAFIFINELPAYKGIIAFEFVKRFVLISALMIPFEIYDSQYDDKSLNTLPQKYGIETAKRVGYWLLLLFVLLEVLNFSMENNLKIQYLVIDIIIAIVIAIAIYFSSIKRNQYYTSFWVESIPILWLVLLVLFQ